MSEPKTSILMANYNKADYIAQAIKSVLAQNFVNWELIIFDDYSSDSSVKIISDFLVDQRIRLITSDHNIGYIRALKNLVDSAKSEILCLLDSDDALAPDALAEISKAYAEHPECGFIYTQCWYCEENLRRLHMGFSKEIPASKTNLHANSVVAMRTYKKAEYYKTAGYDEEILFAEDLDLTLKMEEVTKLYFLDRPLYYYRVLSASQTHGFNNIRINRSSVALARLNAYHRRSGTNIQNLNKLEISEVLFWGALNGLLCLRWNLVKKFLGELFKINPTWFFHSGFYVLIFNKVVKIIKLKREKPLLKI